MISEARPNSAQCYSFQDKDFGYVIGRGWPKKACPLPAACYRIAVQFEKVLISVWLNVRRYPIHDQTTG
jgi:hypothetical protein